ncbi:ribosomal protein S18-alanine N-acetyltransferase [Shewanella maritima]|uniref:ribosomal protein S18-alanine N-acetyltransferase n=1 Tax=Shewanella maritima TaxID=2520507 RepID=UPI0037370D20
MTDWQILPLSEDDVPRMHVIEVAAHSHPWSEVSLAGCFGKLYRCIGVYCAETNQLQGFAIVQQIIDEVTLMDICVHPDAQGCGLGKQLLNEVITQAQSNRAVKIMLEVRRSNTSAIGLYVSQGFEHTGIRNNYYPTATGQEDALLLDYTF